MSKKNKAFSAKKSTQLLEETPIVEKAIESPEIKVEVMETPIEVPKVENKVKVYNDNDRLPIRIGRQVYTMYYKDIVKFGYKVAEDLIK